MSDLGEDIQDAHIDVGTSFEVIRSGGNLSGEYCILQTNRQVTKPFIREFFQDGRFSYATQVVAGDVILSSDGRHFLAMNLTPTVFQDEIIENSIVLYKCNVSGELLRPSEEEGWNSEYRMTGGFAQVAQDVFALQTEALYGHELDSDNELADLGLEEHELYVPASSGIQILDRYQATSGEYFKVETIKKRRFDQVWVCQLTEDTR